MIAVALPPTISAARMIARTRIKVFLDFSDMILSFLSEKFAVNILESKALGFAFNYYSIPICIS